MNDDELYAELVKRIARNAQAVGEPPTAVDVVPEPGQHDLVPGRGGVWAVDRSQVL